MATIRKAADTFRTGPAPLLLPDTSALLDIPRAVEASAMRTIRAAAAVSAAASETPPRCGVAVASLTTREFDNNTGTEERKLANWLSDLDARAERVEVAFRHLGHARPTLSRVSGLGLPGELVSLARSILGAAVPLEVEDAPHQRAMRRAIEGRRPAGKGRIQDAIMTEEFLELCRALRGAGFTEPIVFLSSNTRDFCTGERHVLHPDLEPDFAAVGLTFCTQWSEASRALRI